MHNKREINFLVKLFRGRFICFHPCGKLPLKCGSVQQNHRTVMKAEHGGKIPQKLDVISYQGYEVGVGVARNRRFLDGVKVEFLRTLGFGVRLFYPTLGVQLNRSLHRTLKLGTTIEMV